MMHDAARAVSFALLVTIAASTSCFCRRRCRAAGRRADRFLKLYGANYAMNRYDGQNHDDAYRNIFFEVLATSIETSILKFLERNRDIHAKLANRQPLDADDLARVSEALSRAAQEGQLKEGYQIIQGTLVYVQIR